jgi:hypothetical protein
MHLSRFLEERIMTVNISEAASRSSWPAWNMRGRIRRVSAEGNIIEGEWACQGEFVRISPRFQRGGRNFRVRPERPAIFFAAWLFEHGVLPALLTPEECEQEWALDMLDPLWATHKGHFFKLESPNAACDQATAPNHRTGFSFCVLQALVAETGSVRSSNGSQGGMMVANVQGSGESQEAFRKKIEEMRARAGQPNATKPPKGKK